MNTKSALAELRRKKRCIESAIRALEKLQRIEESATKTAATRPRQTGTDNVVILPRPHPRSS